MPSISCKRTILLFFLVISAGYGQKFEGISAAKKVALFPKEAAPESREEDHPKVIFPTSDIDLDIPVGKGARPNAIGVVIGISQYAHPDVPDVDYAERDAKLMRRYMVSSLGLDEENIITAMGTEATKAAFNRIFEGQLANYVQAGESEVIVYYSGHGAPDVASSNAYFVPYDADPNYAAQTGYSLETFYTQLAGLEAKALTVVLDACFSGGSEGGMLIRQASPIFISVESPVAALENGAVMTSSSGDQISSWYRKVGHGLFTYYFLKGLRGIADKDGDDAVTTTELFGYIMENVPYLARRLHNREQTPQLMGGSLEQILVAY